MLDGRGAGLHRFAASCRYSDFWVMGVIDKVTEVTTGLWLKCNSGLTGGSYWGSGVSPYRKAGPGFGPG